MPARGGGGDLRSFQGGGRGRVLTAQCSCGPHMNEPCYQKTYERHERSLQYRGTKLPGRKVNSDGARYLALPLTRLTSLDDIVLVYENVNVILE